MNVLFIGPYRDGTGWAHAAIDYIRALDSVGVNVACRPIKLNGYQAPPHPRIKELEEASYASYDSVIQNVLPHQMDYWGGAGRNVALYYTETSNFLRSQWADRLNLMDASWVSCYESLVASERSGVTIPIEIVPIPCDISKYERSYSPLKVRDVLKDQFIFYTIGEFVKRKNLRALLTAFHLEFDVNEGVSLLIKSCPKGNQSEADALREVSEYCNRVKEGLKIYNSPQSYKSEIIITGNYSDEEIYRLHNSCDCGVFPSYGEAWSIPCFDSMAFGKTPIVTAYGGFVEYIDEYNGFPVIGHLEPAHDTQLDTYGNIHTACEEWMSIDVNRLRSALRSAFTDGDVRRQKALAGIQRAYSFSYEKIGGFMKERLVTANGI